MLGLRLSISLFQGFYKKIVTSKIKFDKLEVKSLVGLGNNSN